MRIMKTLLTYIAASFLALAAASARAEDGTSRTLAIVAPSAAQTLVDESGSVVIALAPLPALGDGDRIVVRVDEQIVVLPPGQTKFALTGVPSGSYVLEAIIVDAEGDMVAATETVVFTVSEMVKA
jgi:hypothetical protein